MTTTSPPAQINNTNNKNQIDTSHKVIVVPRISNRQKRQPIIRNKDFFNGNSNFTKPQIFDTSSLQIKLFKIK